MTEIKDLMKAHGFSINHKTQILNDKKCGCFYCLEVFSPNDIKEWIKDKIDYTAKCPFCGIDSVICESSGYPITKEFLLQMKEYFF
jgi:hypothetical protein